MSALWPDRLACCIICQRMFIFLYVCECVMQYQSIVVTCDLDKQTIYKCMYKYIFEYSVIFMRSLICEVVLCVICVRFA